MRILDVAVKDVKDMHKQDSHHRMNLKWIEERQCVSDESFSLAHHPLYLSCHHHCYSLMAKIFIIAVSLLQSLK